MYSFIMVFAIHNKDSRSVRLLLWVPSHLEKNLNRFFKTFCYFSSQPFLKFQKYFLNQFTKSKPREAASLKKKKRAKQQANRPNKKLASRTCHIQTRKCSNKRNIHIRNYPNPIQKGAYDRVFQSNVGKRSIFEYHSIPFFPYCLEDAKGAAHQSFLLFFLTGTGIFMEYRKT